VIATTAVSARRYDRVRIEFDRVEADLTGGVQVGGSLLTGVVRVDVGSGDRVVIEREVTIEARAGATTNLEIDLNASAWLNRASAGARTVTAADFSSAVLVRAR
jgi:hypothetical protein